MSPHYRLQVIRAEDIQWKPSLHRSVPNLYVEVVFGPSVQKTKVIKKCLCPTWNETLIFAHSDGVPRFKVQVKHKSRFSDPCVGAVNVEVSDLLAKSTNREASFVLSSSDCDLTSTASSPFIVLHLEVCDAISAARNTIASASEDIRRYIFQSLEGVSCAGQTTSDGITRSGGQSDLYKAVGELLARLDVFKRIADTLSEIHPFLTIAWNMASILYSAVNSVFETDGRVVGLVQAMSDAFSFVNDVQTLREKSTGLQESINGLLKQIIECCLFVRQYVRPSFFGRMLDLSSSQKVDDFERSLASFKQQIHSGVVLHTAFVSMRTSQRLDDLSLLQLLNPSHMDGFHRGFCHPGTRAKIRSQIMEWAFSETSQNIFWLHGVAGSGKSTVSTSVADQLRELSRLGAYLFFERGKSDPSSVIRTIAYKLALFDSLIGSNILSEIETDKDVATASPLHQFRKLLLQPLQAVANSISEPVIVVLDALDECGSSESRRSLLELFRNEFPKLPNNFRFLITSRRETDVDKYLSSNPVKIRAWELDYASEGSREDVLAYLRFEMRNIFGDPLRIPVDWPWDENMELLGKAADGLFIWASTAVRMVRSSSPKFRRLEHLVSDSLSLSGFGLDELYTTVLRSSGIEWSDGESAELFRMVVAVVLLTKIPVSIEDIDGILGFPTHQSSSEILSSLRSVVSYSPGEPVRLLHTSFSDYLLSPSPSNYPWFIDVSAAQRLIVGRCFTVMKNHLCFNICALGSSFVRNDDIGDLENRVKARIPSHLEYACIYWTQHLLAVSYSTDLSGKLGDFAHYHLLFWFEVLSLVKALGRVAHRALLEAASWCDRHDRDIGLFLRDASKLVTIFALPILQSTPHIYVSMIPLSEHDSGVAKHYAKFMSSLVRVERVGAKSPPLWLKVLEGHSSWVNCVAFSPNGQHVASASPDRTIRVWDIGSGEEICMPLTGHTDWVTSVYFSPDGSLVVSGSRDQTLRVWDARTGQQLLGPLEGHDGRIRAVAWSPDGTMIASASEDNTVIIWDATEGKAACRLVEQDDGNTEDDDTEDDDTEDGFTKNHTSVAFSSDSTQVAFGSNYGAIRIWDVKSEGLAFGQSVELPFSVESVAFSPDGTHIVSGSNDRTIKICKIGRGCVVSSLEGHTSVVASAAYSPCGTRIVSGSWDKTVKVWDAKSGKVISTLNGHTNRVNSVTFSPDGKYIASGSNDKSVRIWDAIGADDYSHSSIKHSDAVKSVAFNGGRVASASDDFSIIVWDAQSGDVALGPLIGHTGRVSSVAFSPDGSRLFSGAYDETIRIWNAETGEPISVPLRHSERVTCIAVSPCDNTVASGSYDGTISMWNIATGELTSIGGHSKKTVCTLAFSPNGKHLASGSWDKTIKIWNTENWAAMREPLVGHTRAVISVCFSPDGRLLVSGSDDRSIIIWDVAGHRKIAGPIEEHESFVTSVLFSRDGRHVISGSWDRTIRIWNLESGRIVCELIGHTDTVWTIALSPDGCKLISGSEDRTIRVWDLSDLLVPSVKDAGNSALITASPPDSSNWILRENGWVFGRPDERDLLLWLPPDLRTALWSSRTTAILSCDFSTKLDFSGAALGEEWANCFRDPGR